MASFPKLPDGRSFTAEELIGQCIRIEGPVPKKGNDPLGYAMWVIANDEQVSNVSKIEMSIEPCSTVEAKITLYHGETISHEAITEDVVLRDNIKLSLSAIASEVQ